MRSFSHLEWCQSKIGMPSSLSVRYLLLYETCNCLLNIAYCSLRQQHMYALNHLWPCFNVTLQLRDSAHLYALTPADQWNGSQQFSWTSPIALYDAILKQWCFTGNNKPFRCKKWIFHKRTKAKFMTTQIKHHTYSRSWSFLAQLKDHGVNDAGVVNYDGQLHCC